MPFKFTPTQLPEVILIEPRVFDDGRGYFLEFYKQSDFKKNDISESFVQDNHSESSKGVLRGLHYQINPKAQGKLIRCIRGEIFDVAIDIRKSSPNFGKWMGDILSADNKKMFYIPVGFAHGFLTLSDVAEITYKTTAEYHPDYEKGIRWDDPDINIDWFRVSGNQGNQGNQGTRNKYMSPDFPDFDIHLSDRDLQLPFLKNVEVFE
jgi:dTDP-4-dehydrorhamnose 3,5-epimerase